MKVSRAAALLVVCAACSPASVSTATAAHPKASWHHDDRDDGPLVTGHRGAPGYLPDHTLEGYKLAIRLGADYIEPDVVSTKDGYLIARHEPNIGGTTDVASKFPASRMNTYNVDGALVTDYFGPTSRSRRSGRCGRSSRCRSSVRPSSTASSRSRRSTRCSSWRSAAASACIRRQHPTFHVEHGLPLERKLVDALKRHGLNHKKSPVIIQSFEQSNLKALNKITPVRSSPSSSTPGT